MNTKEDLEVFVGYEIANSFLCSMIWWDSGQDFMAKIMVNKVEKKYLNYKKFLSEHLKYKYSVV